LPLHVSNVAYYLQDQKSPTKIGFEITAKGKRVRIAKKTGQKIS